VVTIVSLVAAVIPVTLLWLTRGGARDVPRWIRRFPGLKPVLEAFESAPRETLHDRKAPPFHGCSPVCDHLLDAATLRAMMLGLATAFSPTVAFASFVLASVVATVSPCPAVSGPSRRVGGDLRVLGVPLEVAVAATLLFRGFHALASDASRTLGRAPGDGEAGRLMPRA